MERPAQSIIFDRELANRHPGKGFWVRIERENGDVDLICIEGVHSMPQARKVAAEKGYAPTHHTTDRSLIFLRF